MNNEAFKLGETHGYELFSKLLQSFASLVSPVLLIKGQEFADEYTLGILYALEDKMADLEQTVRGDD